MSLVEKLSVASLKLDTSFFPGCGISSVSFSEARRGHQIALTSVSGERDLKIVSLDLWSRFVFESRCRGTPTAQGCAGGKVF